MYNEMYHCTDPLKLLYSADHADYTLYPAGFHPSIYSRRANCWVLRSFDPLTTYTSGWMCWESPQRTLRASSSGVSNSLAKTRYDGVGDGWGLWTQTRTRNGEDKDKDSVYRTDSARSCRSAVRLLSSSDWSTFALWWKRIFFVTAQLEAACITQSSSWKAARFDLHPSRCTLVSSKEFVLSCTYNWQSALLCEVMRIADRTYVLMGYYAWL